MTPPTTSAATAGEPPDDPYEGVPEQPVVRVVLRDDGTGTVDGRFVDIPDGADRHPVLLAEACRLADDLGHPVRVVASDAHTEWDLVARPDGVVLATGISRPVSSVTSLRTGYVPVSIPAPVSSPAPTAGYVPDAAPPPARPAAHPAAHPAARPVVPVVPVMPVVPVVPVVPVPASAPAPPRLSPGPSSRDDVTTAIRVAREVAPRPRSGPGLIGTGRSGTPSTTTFPTTSSIWPATRTPGVLLIGAVLVAVLGVLAALVSPSGDDAADARDGRPDTRRDTPGSTSAADTPLTTLPVAGPPGFDTRPAWSVPIAAWTRSVAADGGTVLSRDPAGHILLIDAATGAVRWRSSEQTALTQDGPWLTSVGGRPVAAVVGNGALTYWPLPSAPAASASSPPGRPATASAGPSGATAATVRPVTVKLPPKAVVSWTGPSPLVISPNAAGVIGPQGYRSVAVPPGGRALAADGTAILAVTATSFIRREAGRRPTAPRDLPRPRGAAARPVRIEAVGASLLFTVWPRSGGAGQIGALVDVASGTLAVQTDLAATLDLARVGVVRETAGRQTAVGSVLVDTYTSNLDLLEPRYTVRAVTRGHAWAMLDGKAVDIVLDKGGKFDPVPFPAGEPAIPIGLVSGTRQAPTTAVLVAPWQNAWLLCGVRATSTESGR